MPSIRFRTRPVSGWPWIVASLSLLLVGTLAGIQPATAQLPPQESLQAMSVADGFEVRLFASEPMITNPIAMDIDSHGRVWVTEGANYRKNVTNPPNNKIKILEDTDGDGVADKMTVFTSDLNAAMGVCVAGSKIYVPESPNLYVYEDRDGDLKPDGPRQTLLTGFGGQNHDHGVHSQRFGPDHKLYMTQGDSGYNVTGPDGRHIQFRWGAMLRCEADGTRLEDFAVNFRNPFELAVDSFGNVWCSDNDNDGLKSVRLCWILEGGNYGWFGSPEMIREADGSFNPIHHWRADKPGFVPYTLITGFGSPCGMTFYEGSAFGKACQGKLLHCDAGPREVRAYTPARLSGVGYSARTQNLVTSRDGYFRPVDPCIAPDGSIFVTDWYDGGVGGHAYNDPTHGRIYRMTPKGKTLQRTNKPGPYKTDADAVMALASPNLATQFQARERLLASGAAAIPALQKLTASDNRVLKARALWLLGRIGGAGRHSVQAELKSADPAFRALAVRILRRDPEQCFADLMSVSQDSDGEVLKEVLLGLGSIETDAATDAIADIARRYDGHDRYLLEAIGIAATGREAAVFAKAVEQSGTPFTAVQVELTQILRKQEGANVLASKLGDPKLTEETRSAILTALTLSTDPQAGAALLPLLTGKATPETRAAILRALGQNLTGTWKPLQNDAALDAALRSTLAEPELLTATLQVIGQARLTKFNDLLLTAMNTSTVGTAQQIAIIRTLVQLGAEKAGAGLIRHAGSATPELREEAIKAIVALRDSNSWGRLLSDPEVKAETRSRLVDQLMISSDGAIYLFRLLETDKLAKSLARQVIGVAGEHPDVNIRLLYQKYIPESERPKTLGQSFTADEILKLTGDVKRGEAVFLRSGAASCNKCHRVSGKGADIGPDLSQIGRKYERRALLEAIMAPSAGIAPEYIPYVVETTRGKVYAGFIPSQTDEQISLKAIDGLVLNLPRSEVEEIVKQSVSLMPELVLKNVTAQDAADLLAYLASLKTEEIQAGEFRVLGPFPNKKPEDRQTDFGPEKTAGQPDFQARYSGLQGPVTWTNWTAKSGTDNQLQVDAGDLGRGLKAPAVQVIYYFATVLDSQGAQPARLLIGSDDGVQVWLNGEKIHDARVTRALQPRQDRVPVQLKSGKNLILLKLDQGQGAGGLSLAVEATSKVQFLRP